MLAGPASPSPSVVPAQSVRRARHLVPPPSTPSRSTSASMTVSVFARGPSVNTREPKKDQRVAGQVPMDTERPRPRYADIDVWEPAATLDAMIEGQFAAGAAVRAALGAIERAAAAVHMRLQHGGRLIYAGAGTSGRLAIQDGAELMPTFNWPSERLLLLMA